METSFHLTDENGQIVHITYENTGLILPHRKHQYGQHAPCSPFFKKKDRNQHFEVSVSSEKKS
jgi:hypothetical protein